MFDHDVKKSMSTQGHYLNSLSSARVPNATHQLVSPSVHWFQRRRIFKGFNYILRGGHVGHVNWTILANYILRGGHVGHVNWTILANFATSIPEDSTCNTVTIGPVALEKMFEIVKKMMRSWSKVKE